VLRTALTSRTSACGRLNSTSLSRFASVRHPWRPALVFGPPVRRFQRGPGHRCISRCFRDISAAAWKSPGGGAARLSGLPNLPPSGTEPGNPGARRKRLTRATAPQTAGNS